MRIKEQQGRVVQPIHFSEHSHSYRGRALILPRSCYRLLFSHQLFSSLPVHPPFIPISNMFSKVLFALAFVMGLTLHVQAHAVIAPPLGVTGTPVRNDVQRPSTASPCGNINIAQTLDKSTPVAVGASGAFSVAVTNFNTWVQQ